MSLENRGSSRGGGDGRTRSPARPAGGSPQSLTPCWGSDKGEDGGDGLTEAAAATALPASAQPGPAQPGSAQPHGRWSFGGQGVRAKPAGQWEGELKEQ